MCKKNKIKIKKRVFFVFVWYNINIGDDENVQKYNEKVNILEK